MKQRLKINGIIIFFVVLLTALFPELFLRGHDTSALDEAADILGLACILLGQLFRISARGYKAEHSQDSQRLVQGGPYALVRNPMYLGILLVGLGVVLVLLNLWAAILFLAIFIVRYATLIFKEEKKLLGIFGNDYVQYRHRVPRIVPRLKTLAVQDVGKYLPLKPSWIGKEIGSMIAVLMGVLLVESWEDIIHEGFRVYLRESAALFSTIGLFVVVMLYLSRRQQEAP